MSEKIAQGDLLHSKVFKILTNCQYIKYSMFCGLKQRKNVNRQLVGVITCVEPVSFGINVSINSSVVIL